MLKRSLIISVKQWRTKEEVNEELKNCVVLCFNCHMELHDGLISLNKNVVPVELNNACNQ